MQFTTSLWLDQLDQVDPLDPVDPVPYAKVVFRVRKTLLLPLAALSRSRWRHY